MRLITISITEEHIKTSEVEHKNSDRLTHCAMSLAAKEVLNDFVMVGRGVIQDGVFSLDLPSEAAEWLAYNDRYFQGLEIVPSQPLTFKVLHPL